MDHGLWTTVRSALEDEVHRQHQEHEPDEVIEPEGFVFEEEQREDDEDDQGDHFLDHFQLNEGEGSSEFLKTDPVSGNLEHILKQGNPPADEDDAEQPEVLTPGHLLEAQVAVPREGHEGVGEDQETDGEECFHRFGTD